MGAGGALDARIKAQRHSQTAAVNYSLFDVGASVAALNPTYGTGSGTALAIYADLGSGTGYGSCNIGTGLSTDVLTLELNEAARSAILASASGFFSVGGAVQSSAFGDLIFGSGPDTAVSLEIDLQDTSPGAAAVPEPGSALLLIPALAAVAWIRRRSS